MRYSKDRDEDEGGDGGNDGDGSWDAFAAELSFYRQILEVNLRRLGQTSRFIRGTSLKKSLWFLDDFRPCSCCFILASQAGVFWALSRS